MRRYVFGVLTGVLLLPVGGLVVGWMGLLEMRAKVPAPRWESALAGVARDASVARRAPRVKNPVAASEENLMAGLKIYKDACAGCHGNPAAESDYGVSFYPPVPQFAEHPPRKPDWQLYWIVKNGVRYSGMSAWDGQWQPGTSEDHIWKVVAFLSRLDSLPPTVEAEWRKP